MSDKESTANRVDVDMLIVGAGPAGLFAAYYAGFRGLSVAVIDSLPEPGGQINAMYPEKEIFDIAGFPSVRGRVLIEQLLAQSAPYESTYLLGQVAEKLAIEGTPGAGGFFIVTNRAGLTVTAKAIIITGGIGNFMPRPLAAAAQFEGAGLAYFVRCPDEYAGTDLVIAGGGDSAFDWAHALGGVADSVTIVHRRDYFRAHPAMVNTVRASGATIIGNAQISKIHGVDAVSAVDVTTNEGLVHSLACQKIIAALGFTANLGPLLQWGINIRGKRYIAVDTFMQTNMSGIYAAGDISDYPGKLRLIAVGFGEAATAVNNAAHFIDPDCPVFPGHSTDNDAKLTQLTAVG